MSSRCQRADAKELILLFPLALVSNNWNPQVLTIRSDRQVNYVKCRVHAAWSKVWGKNVKKTRADFLRDYLQNLGVGEVGTAYQQS